MTVPFFKREGKVAHCFTSCNSKIFRHGTGKTELLTVGNGDFLCIYPLRLDGKVRCVRGG